MEALKANKKQFIKLFSPNCCGRNILSRMRIFIYTSLSLPSLSVCLIVLYLSLCRDNAENMYFFSSLALTLNEPEEGVAPTDSRLRPDQRLMEAGLWDEANLQKQRLEEGQRLERKRREAQASQALEEGETEEAVKSHNSL